jgi:hypothetical protein
MNAVRPKPSAPSTVGKKQTNSQKLLYIASQLGIDLKGMQGSTMNIVDTVSLNYSANRQTLEFFTNTQSKTRTFSNFQSGNLNAGEAMVMEEVKFFILTLNQPSLTDPTTRILDVNTFTSMPFGLVADPKPFMLGLMNITIANSQVVKDYQINDASAEYNRKTTGIALAEALNTPGVSRVALNQFHGQTTIELESPPVLPPNQKTKVTLEIPPITGGTPNLAIMCTVGRFGSIFSSNTPL